MACIKKQYKTRFEAEMVAARAWTKRQVDLRAYLCIWCGYHHLTSQSKKGKR